MKSAHRHQLETNALAQRLDVFIERLRPYAATVAGVVLAIVVIMFVWSYVSGSSAARQGEAWDAYHRGVAPMQPDLDQLRQSAEEYPGTRMQQMANITWADGQVWIASREYLHNREAAMEALRRATSAYQSILQTSDNDRLKSRAHLGMARVYEMQNDLEKARDEYLKVEGGYALIAKQQAERLESQEVKDAYAWLATAEAPRPRAPVGPGAPGQRPEFSADEFALPGETAGPESTDGAPAESFEEVLKRFDLNFPKSDGDNRYPSGEETTESPEAIAPSTDAATPETDADTTDAEKDTPATEDQPVE